RRAAAPSCASSAGLNVASARRLAPHPRQPLLVALPIALLFRGALVVLLLALGNTDLQFGAAVFPVQLERHERVALALHGGRESAQLFRIQQQFARADRVGDDM